MFKQYTRNSGSGGVLKILTHALVHTWRATPADSQKPNRVEGNMSGYAGHKRWEGISSACGWQTGWWSQILCFLICLSFEYNVYILWVWDHLDHYTMFLVVGFGSNYPNLGPLSCWLQKRSLAQFKLVAELVAGEFTPDSRTLTVIA